MGLWRAYRAARPTSRVQLHPQSEKGWSLHWDRRQIEQPTWLQASSTRETLYHAINFYRALGSNSGGFRSSKFHKVHVNFSGLHSLPVVRFTSETAPQFDLGD